MDIPTLPISPDVHTTPGQRSLLDSLLESLSEGGRKGFAELISDFQTHDLGEVMASWVGVGRNLSVTALQVRRGMGEARILYLADTTNLSPARVVDSLAEMLPVLVNALTPDGKLPDQNSLHNCLRFLRSQLLDR